MRLPEPILRLPLTFDAAALATEIAALPDAAWVPHPNKLPGNEAVLLVTPDGELTNDIGGRMMPTPHLEACPYVMQVMAAIGAVWGRSRLMRIAPGGTVPPHVDTNFYWRTHLRIHVPIITTPDVRFTVAGNTVHMAAGECWVFDTFSMHQVVNGGIHKRTHLVLDTVGGEGLHDLIERTRRLPDNRSRPVAMTPETPRAHPLAFEQFPTQTVMTPWELGYHVDFIREAARPGGELASVMSRLDRLVAGWNAAWAQHGSTAAGIPIYEELLVRLNDDLRRIGGSRLLLRNGLLVYNQIGELAATARATLHFAAPVGTAPGLRAATR